MDKQIDRRVLFLAVLVDGTSIAQDDQDTARYTSLSEARQRNIKIAKIMEIFGAL